MHCVVPENIPHFPTKQIGNFQGEWGGGGGVSKQLTGEQALQLDKKNILDNTVLDV